MEDEGCVILCFVVGGIADLFGTARALGPLGSTLPETVRNSGYYVRSVYTVALPWRGALPMPQPLATVEKIKV